MDINTAFNEMLSIRGVYKQLGLSRGAVGFMRNSIKTGKKNISIDKKIELLNKAGYTIAQELLFTSPKNISK